MSLETDEGPSSDRPEGPSDRTPSRSPEPLGTSDDRALDELVDPWLDEASDADEGTPDLALDDAVAMEVAVHDEDTAPKRGDGARSIGLEELDGSDDFEDRPSGGALDHGSSPSAFDDESMFDEPSATARPHSDDHPEDAFVVDLDARALPAMDDDEAEQDRAEPFIELPRDPSALRRWELSVCREVEGGIHRVRLDARGLVALGKRIVLLGEPTGAPRVLHVPDDLHDLHGDERRTVLRGTERLWDLDVGRGRIEPLGVGADGSVVVLDGRAWALVRGRLRCVDEPSREGEESMPADDLASLGVMAGRLVALHRASSDSHRIVARADDGRWSVLVEGTASDLDACAQLFASSDVLAVGWRHRLLAYAWEPSADARTRPTTETPAPRSFRCDGVVATKASAHGTNSHVCILRREGDQLVIHRLDADGSLECLAVFDATPDRVVRDFAIDDDRGIVALATSRGLEVGLRAPQH